MGKRSAFALASACTAVSLLAAGCSGAAHTPSASPRHGTSTTMTTTTVTTSTTTPAPSTTTTSAAGTTTTARPHSPGVLANCTLPPPQSLSVEPPSIVVACADDGIGAEHLTWTSWTATTALATGEVWQNDCTPYCAEGTIKYYPASVALSGVESSRDGLAFTVMTATYSGAQPNGKPVDTFGLELPQG